MEETPSSRTCTGSMRTTGMEAANPALKSVFEAVASKVLELVGRSCGGTSPMKNVGAPNMLLAITLG